MTYTPLTEAAYIAYWEQLARTHTATRHSDTHRTFFVVNPDSLREVTEAIHKQLHYPALLLDSYTEDLLIDQDNFRIRVSGGITVVVRCQKGAEADRRRARHEARQLARGFIHRMRLDCYPGGALNGFNVRPGTEFRGEVAPFLLDTVEGFGYSFDWLAPSPVSLSEGDWSDQ